MKRKLVVLVVLSVLLLAVPAGVAVAKSAPQAISFDFMGTYEVSEPISGNVTGSPPANVTLTGHVKDKNGAQYLTPLNGVITIGEAEYQILVKEAKQSEPVFYWEWERHYSNSSIPYYWVYRNWNSLAEVNIEGSKCIGWLSWQSVTTYNVTNDEVLNISGSSELNFSGVVDGNMVNGYLDGDFPEIGEE